ncbi:MAG: hypothetical protein ABFQ95_05220 [Pseudomonadota bacterium]
MECEHPPNGYHRQNGEFVEEDGKLRMRSQAQPTNENDPQVNIEAILALKLVPLAHTVIAPHEGVGSYCSATI